MKKGFSLIEIVQTLVLIGIIAGISVSLFKRVDNDIKLLEEALLKYNLSEKEIKKVLKSISVELNREKVEKKLGI